MIIIRELTKYYGSVKALDQFSLEITTGEKVVIQGPSGSGKTTLLRLIAGLELPDQGQIYMDGKLVSAPGWATPPYTRHLGFVFQRSALWPHMTVAQNIRFAMNGVSKSEASTMLRTLLQQTALESLTDRYPSQLSGGEARRVALARALASQPQYLLLDEPLTSLDPDLQGQLLQVIHDYINTKNATLLYVTHASTEAESIDGTLYQLARGRLNEPISHLF